jgi:N5-(cytidine 5'-diphosphoramidyl)-L-glutamine hydrolase
MTLVGITQRCLPPNEVGERRYALDVRWFAFLAECGLTPVPLPNTPDLAVASAASAGVRGLVLSGGDDLGAYPHRDETERRLLTWAMACALPVIGVCRGMQLLVCALGGDLAPVDGHVATRHPVRAGGRRRMVNSYHRLAPVAVPAGLEVTARCGPVVEAVRHREAAVVGMMWHAEREDPFADDDIRTFREQLGGRT